MEIYYTEIMAIIKPILELSGWLALSISLIVMLVNMVIDAFCGRGFRIGREK